MNDITQTSEMDICLRFWNDETNKVEDRYWDSEFLGHTTHQDLHDSLQEWLKLFDMEKMVQLLMDRPNMNLKLLQKVKHSQDELGHSQLTDFAYDGALKKKAGSEESG